MSKRFIICAAAVLFSWSAVYAQDENTQDAVSGSFIEDGSMSPAEYRKKIEAQAEEYSRITYEEMDLLRRRARQVWGDGYLTSQSLWVDYSPDMKIRRSVEFETGAISVETIADGEAPGKDFFTDGIAGLISATTASVFKSDPLVTGIERRMKEAGMDAVYADVKELPVLAPIVTGYDYPPEDVVRDKAEEIFDSGSVRTYRLRNGKLIARFDGRINVSSEPGGLDLDDGFLRPGGLGGKVHKSAARYKESVARYASQYRIPAALVYAVIHNESSFNPFATSYIPAYGLMQLVPQSGGLAASGEIFGREIILSPSYLYDYSDNIQLGSAYLSKIYHDYFYRIKDWRSRLYCTIAAYNTGIGNVARAFTGTYNLRYAESVINSMTADQCYAMLMRNLPYGQTKAYLKKVTESYNAYLGY